MFKSFSYFLIIKLYALVKFVSVYGSHKFNEDITKKDKPLDLLYSDKRVL